MIEDKDIARFDSFLNGEMNKKEKLKFIQELKDDNELRSAFEEHQSFVEAMRRSGRTAMLSSIAAAHESMRRVEPKEYRSHNGKTWRKFFRNLFVFGILATAALFGIKHWEDIKDLNNRLEENSMQFGGSREVEIRVFVDTVKTEAAAFDTTYREIKVSGSSPEEVQKKLQEEMERVKRENPNADIEMMLEERE
ncbi:MAG: hypothetical protein AAF487_01860 [Bacteroidota bacterium]